MVLASRSRHLKCSVVTVEVHTLVFHVTADELVALQADQSNWTFHEFVERLAL